MAAKSKKPAAKAKAAKAAKAPVAKPAVRPATARAKNDDLVANFVAYAQKNPAMAVVGIIVVLVAFVLLFK